ncbi:MAG TPA: hypothetical protein VGF09_02535 [Solirubrobacterales bacterium]|jgi:hypothetical protein
MASSPRKDVVQERSGEGSDSDSARTYRLKRREAIAEGVARIASGRAENGRVNAYWEAWRPD